MERNQLTLSKMKSMQRSQIARKWINSSRVNDTNMKQNEINGVAEPSELKSHAPTQLGEMRQTEID